MGELAVAPSRGPFNAAGTHGVVSNRGVPLGPVLTAGWGGRRSCGTAEGWVNTVAVVGMENEVVGSRTVLVFATVTGGMGTAAAGARGGVAGCSDKSSRSTVCRTKA